MNYIPQGAMHRMRAGFADGAPVRNRSFEQQRTRSGNPNMPIFNNARQQMPPAVGGGMAVQPPRQGVMGTPSVGYLPQLMGSQSMSKPAMSFHRPAAPMRGRMPDAPVPIINMNQNVGSRYSDYFGRQLPIRLRG